jgi:hypothetical protein
LDPENVTGYAASGWLPRRTDATTEEDDVERMQYVSDAASHMEMVDAVNAAVDAQEHLASVQAQASFEARLAALRAPDPRRELPPERPKRRKAVFHQVKY